MNFGEAKANDIIFLEGKKFVFKKMSTEPFWCLQEGRVMRLSEVIDAIQNQIETGFLDEAVLSLKDLELDLTKDGL